MEIIATQNYLGILSLLSHDGGRRRYCHHQKSVQALLAEIITLSFDGRPIELYPQGFAGLLSHPAPRPASLLALARKERCTS